MHRHSHVFGVVECPARPAGVRPLGRRAALRRARMSTWSVAALFLDRLELLGGGVALLHHPVERLEQVLELGVGRLLDLSADDFVDLARGLALQQPFRRLHVHPDHSGSFPPVLGVFPRIAVHVPCSLHGGTAFVPGAAGSHGPAWRPARLQLFETQSAISIPMLRAVPITIRSAASTVAELRSGAFSSAISRTCFLVTFPTLLRLGWP